MTKTLFPTAAELQAPPPKKNDDLSRIVIIPRDSPEGQAILKARAERAARMEGAGLDETQVGMLSGLKEVV